MKKDECASFMIASSGTTMRVIARLLYYVTRNPEMTEKIREEFQAIFKTQLKELNHPRLEKEDFLRLLTYDNLLSMKYLSSCISETLRIEPSVPISSPFKFTEPVQIGNHYIRDDHYCQINIYGLHHNPAEW
mmetsp:Transcript_41075/g.39595  ORF Transcript_41075/g.39595 Transcript_41075/m.39595 type:complete len:132 (-) Transcript_41075:333-728(-)